MYRYVENFAIITGAEILLQYSTVGSNFLLKTL